MTLLVVLFLVTAPADAQDILTWKLKAGDAFTLVRDFQQKQIIEAKPRTFKQETGNVWTSRFEVLKTVPEGYLLQQTLEQVTYRNPAKPPPEQPSEVQLAERLKGMKFTLVLSTAGRIKQIEGYDEAIKKLADNKPEMEKALKYLAPESAFRDGLAESLSFLPEGPVAPGATWERDSIEPSPPFGSFKTRFVYRYEGRDRDVARISYQVTMKYQPPSQELDLFRIVRGSLWGEEGRGLVQFDVTTGRLIEGEKTLKVKGNLILEAAGQQNQLQFSSENRLTYRLR